MQINIFLYITNIVLVIGVAELGVTCNDNDLKGRDHGRYPQVGSTADPK